MPKTFVYTAFGGPEAQQFLDLPIPEAADGQLLVTVRAAGVNPIDWKLRTGYRRPLETLPAPQPMGVEISGVVAGLGAGVEGFSVGDEVFGSVVGNGGFSEYSLLSAAATAHKPHEVTFLDAATLPAAAATAYDGVVQLDLSPGENLLVIGIGGGVGVSVAQIARSRGVLVTGTASAGKKELVESLGARHIAYGPGVAEAVREVLPDGFDALFDTVGGEALAELSGLGRPGAKIVSIADDTVTNFGGRRVERVRSAEVLDTLAEMVATGTLKPMVTEVFPLDQVAAALALVESGHASGKVVVSVS